VAFMQDRHRDYELILSGFTAPRLTNDEFAQDMEKAIEKIRDLVTFCRGRTGQGRLEWRSRKCGR
jgi:very-short-patch-repair endonuclease